MFAKDLSYSHCELRDLGIEGLKDTLGIRQLPIKSCANPPEADKKSKKFFTMPGKTVIERVSKG